MIGSLALSVIVSQLMLCATMPVPLLCTYRQIFKGRVPAAVHQFWIGRYMAKHHVKHFELSVVHT